MRKLLFFLFLIFLLLGFLFYFFFFSDFFKIKKIEVLPQGIVKEDLILKKLKEKKLFGFLPLDNIFLVKAKDLEISFPEIKKVKLEKDFKNRILKVYLEKRKEVLIWCQKNLKCFSVDEEGVAFKEASFIEGLPLIYVIDDFKRKISLAQKVASSKVIKMIKEIYQNFKEKLEIDYFIYPEEKFQEIHLKTKEGVFYLFNLKENFSAQIETLKKLLESGKIKIKEYLDLRSLPRVYYK